MKRFLLAVAAFFLSCFAAQAQYGMVVTACGTVPTGSAYGSPGNIVPFTVDTTGKLCGTASGSSSLVIGTTPITGGTVGNFLSIGAGNILQSTASSTTIVFPQAVSGTVNSGGIPYFSTATVMSSSAVLAANALVVGGGAGVAPATITTGTGVVTALGVNVGSAGAFVVNGGALGTPSSGVLTSATGLPISTGLTGAGTGVITALGVNVGTAGSFVVNGGALGTPSSGTLTNATGLPIAGISGLGTGVGTALGTALSAAGGITSTIASGTAALGTTAIASATCATAVTVAATNVATTDTVTASFNGDPTAVTGYIPATTGMLTIIGYPTLNNVNFKVCNNTSASVTPGAITLNWRVVR